MTSGLMPINALSMGLLMKLFNQFESLIEDGLDKLARKGNGLTLIGV